MIENHSQDLDNYKLAIEKRLIEETRGFQTELEEVRKNVDKLKEQ
jgi:hypothetical protein